jgi:hypothetical protein
MNNLPFELLDIIFSYLPDISKLRLNKYHYKKYHPIVINIIKKDQRESYIRCMIRQDNEFIIRHLLEENYTKWMKIHNYYDKGLEFNNYLCFFKYYCSENNSKKCEYEIYEYIKIK